MMASISQKQSCSLMDATDIMQGIAGTRDTTPGSLLVDQVACLQMMLDPRQCIAIAVM